MPTIHFVVYHSDLTVFTFETYFKIKALPNARPHSLRATLIGAEKLPSYYASLIVLNGYEKAEDNR
jgi:hypothetical protein